MNSFIHSCMRTLKITATPSTPSTSGGHVGLQTRVGRAGIHLISDFSCACFFTYKIRILLPGRVLSVASTQWSSKKKEKNSTAQPISQISTHEIQCFRKQQCIGRWVRIGSLLDFPLQAQSQGLFQQFEEHEMG